MAMYSPPPIVQQCIERVYPLLGSKLAGKIEYLVIAHAILVPLMLIKELDGNIAHFRAYPMQALMVCNVLGLGGCSMLSVMMGRPFAWLLNDYILLSYATSAFFFCTPAGTVFYQLLQRAPYLACPVVYFLNALVRAVGVCTAVQYVKETIAFRQNVVAMLVGVCVYMNFGPMICSTFNLARPEWRLQVPVQITQPVQHVLPSLLLGAVYVFLTERMLFAQRTATMWVVVASLVIYFTCLCKRCMCGAKFCQGIKRQIFGGRGGRKSSSALAAEDEDDTPRRATRLGERKLRSRERD